MIKNDPLTDLKNSLSPKSAELEAKLEEKLKSLLSGLEEITPALKKALEKAKAKEEENSFARKYLGRDEYLEYDEAIKRRDNLIGLAVMKFMFEVE